MLTSIGCLQLDLIYTNLFMELEVSRVCAEEVFLSIPLLGAV
jgi:hypothetical protein